VVLKGYAIAGWASALAATLAFSHILPVWGVLLRYGRAQAFFKDPNVYGPYLVPVVLYGLTALQRRRIGTWAFWGAAVGCGVTVTGVFLSFSRAAWINLAVSVVFFLILQFSGAASTRTFSRGMVLPVLALPLFAGVVALIAMSGGSSFSHLLSDRLGNNGLHGYDTMRFYTQRRALETVLDQPMGIGPGQAEVRFDYSTHNMYVRILSENGVLGFAAFYGFVILSFLRATRFALTLRNRLVRDLFALVSASLLGILVNGFVIDTIHWRHMWLLLGLAWWAPRAAVEES